MIDFRALTLEDILVLQCPDCPLTLIEEDKRLCQSKCPSCDFGIWYRKPAGSVYWVRWRGFGFDLHSDTTILAFHQPPHQKTVSLGEISSINSGTIKRLQKLLLLQ